MEQAMTKPLIHAAFLLLLLVAGFAGQAAAATAPAKEATWLVSYDEAAALAKKTGRPILADFTGSDWCHWCQKLKTEVFDTAEFKDWAKDNAILLEVDFPQHIPQSPAIKAQNQKLQQQFSINGFPTVLILNANGVKIGELGYQEGGPKAWLAEFVKQYRAGAK
jgi:protein disulfide-isomerase